MKISTTILWSLTFCYVRGKNTTNSGEHNELFEVALVDLLKMLTVSISTSGQFMGIQTPAYLFWAPKLSP